MIQKQMDPSLYYLIYLWINPLSSNLSENLDEYVTTTINDYNDTLKDFKVIESNTNSSILGDKACIQISVYGCRI
jgi:hypothetical protein